MHTLTQSQLFTTGAQRSLQACLGWFRSVVAGSLKIRRFGVLVTNKGPLSASPHTRIRSPLEAKT